jgi:hypothetical protein
VTRLILTGLAASGVLPGIAEQDAVLRTLRHYHAANQLSRGVMMSLKDVLDRTRAAGEAKRPPEIVAKMHQGVDDLRTPDVLGRIRKAGDMMPAFALQGQNGIVDSSVLLGKGPLVVTFYRGKW